MFSLGAELLESGKAALQLMEGVPFWSLVTTGVFAMGLLNAAHAIMNVRLAQSAIAWSVFLVSMPWLGIPAYWVFGRRKFNGYRRSLRRARLRCEADIGRLTSGLIPHISTLPPPLAALQKYAARFSNVPFTGGNDVRLLIDGEATYKAMLEAIDAARSYVFLQTYILNDDGTGRAFVDALARAVVRGVHAHLLFDDVGSMSLGRRFLRDARRAGVQVAPFSTTKGPGNRFQWNFRNHRKVLVVDGSVGFTGGLNLGDEHLGRDTSVGPWRDTHLRLAGPAVKSLEYSFLVDWYWATDEIPYPGHDTPLDHVPAPAGDAAVLTLSTGPSDDIDACSLFIGALIDIAEERIWIATPYFVPDEPTLAALKTAALRGVDVRILVPEEPDHLITHLCALSFFEELEGLGVKVFAYRGAFMHQKVFVFDDALAGVGTVNFDNRSFHLNFEVMAYVAEPTFVREVAAMLEADFTRGLPVDLGVVRTLPWPLRVLVRLARLFSAIL
jgi:cardiolipin synthase